MSEIPKRPDDGESMLPGVTPPVWQTVVPQALPPPVTYPAPPSSTTTNTAGYKPVFDGSVPGSGSPPNYPQGNYYPQSNYSQPNVAEMLAIAALMPRRRRVGRWVTLLLVLCFGIIAFALLHGCLGVLRVL